MVRRDGWSSPAAAERHGGDRIRLTGRLVHLSFFGFRLPVSRTVLALRFRPWRFARRCGRRFSPCPFRCSRRPSRRPAARPRPMSPRGRSGPKSGGIARNGTLTVIVTWGFVPSSVPFCAIANLLRCGRESGTRPVGNGRSRWAGIGGCIRLGLGRRGGTRIGAVPCHRPPGFGTPTLRSSESRWNRLPPNRVQ